MVVSYMETCGDDYDGLAELLPEAQSRKQLSHERKDLVGKLCKEVQRLRNTAPNERKWADIFDAMGPQTDSPTTPEEPGGFSAPFYPYCIYLYP